MKSFNPVSCPLVGNHLLDASAGTGKTYSLSFLYLRFVLEQELGVRDILVTTFTRAAVAELKGRIYAVLGDAETILQSFNDDDCCENTRADDGDATLVGYLQSTLRDATARDRARRRLRLARAEFEQVQIFTIDGYFLQLLQQHAFTLNTYAPETILRSDQDIVKAIFFDLARHKFAGLCRPQLTAEVLLAFSPKHFGDNDKADLEDKFSRLLTEIIVHYDYFHSDTDFPAQFIALERQHDELVDAAIALDAEVGAKLDMLSDLVADKKLNSRSYGKIAVLRETLTSPQAWLDIDTAALKPLINVVNAVGFNKLFKATIDAEKLQNDGFFHAVVAFIEQRQYCLHDRPKHLVYAELASAVHAQLGEEKSLKLAHSYADMTAIVAAAAESKQLTATHTAAMIDEAQDTNEAQIAVFKSLFFSPEDKHMFFVGDVKQAIYRFRGANVHAYERVSTHADMQKHRLDTNYRSNQAFNESVNYLFSGLDDFPYAPVKSHHDNCDIDRAEVGLTIVETECNDEDAHVNATIAVIFDLLYGEQRIKDKRIQHHDIAVLVHNKNQGKAIRTALLTHGISASYSARQQVFHSDEAMWLYTMLNAWLTPKTTLLRALLVSPLFARTSEELHDAAHRDALRLQCQRAHEVVNQRGIIVALAQFMHATRMNETLLARIDGRRRLTNLLHLAELLDEKGVSLYALIDALNRHMNADSSESELRIDNDQALTIETIHGSKGLEYPLVIVPFFTRGRAPKTGNTDFMVSHQLRRAGFGFSHVDGLAEAYCAEEADEHYRQIYVALTRGKYRNIIIAGERDADDKSDSTFDQSDWAKLRLPQRIDEVRQQAFCEVVSVSELKENVFGEAIELLSGERDAHSVSLHQLNAERDLTPHWLLDSFSKLNARYPHHELPKAALSSHGSNALPQKTLPENALLAFPRGMNAGHVMHELFETVMARRDQSNIEADIKQTLIERCKDYGLSIDNPDEVSKDFATIMTQPFLPKGRALLDIDLNQQSIEMAFYLHFSPEARMRLLKQFGDVTNTITTSTINGFMNGYIDLMFCLDGKYYVLDYKSNHLGNSVDDYHREAMHAEMKKHRYDLQALIYTIALCKHLRNTLPDFDYDTHIGGYYYLFVRGMQSERETGEKTGVYAAKFSASEIADYLS